MTAEGRTDRAISQTRILFINMMFRPAEVIQMAGLGVTPEQIEDTITDILEYLAKTAPDNMEAPDGS